MYYTTTTVSLTGMLITAVMIGVLRSSFKMNTCDMITILIINAINSAISLSEVEWKRGSKITVTKHTENLH